MPAAVRTSVTGQRVAGATGPIGRHPGIARPSSPRLPALLVPSPVSEGQDVFWTDPLSPTPAVVVACTRGRLPFGPANSTRRRGAARGAVPERMRPNLSSLRPSLRGRWPPRYGRRRRRWAAMSPSASFVHVAPNGPSVNVAEGVRRRFDAGTDPVPFDIDLGDVAHAVMPGHRLRIDVAGAAFPRIYRWPTNDIAPAAPSITAVYPARA